MRAPGRVACGLGLALAASGPAAADGLAVVGATVVGGTAPLADAVVVTDGDHIAAIGTRAVVPIPKGVTIVDGRGRWVAPRRGAKPLAVGRAADFLILDRDPAGDPAALDAPVRIVAAGRLVAPQRSPAPEKGH